jgi:hypothetical protein
MLHIYIVSLVAMVFSAFVVGFCLAQALYTRNQDQDDKGGKLQ